MQMFKTLKIYIRQCFSIIMISVIFINSAAISLATETGTGTEKASQGVLSEITAKSAILVDAYSNTVLFEKDSHKKLAPASVTKVMTMLLIAEAVDSGRVALTDEVTVSEHAAGMGGSQMYMETGERHTLSELLTGISTVSANDACVASSEFISGSSEIFVEAMNQEAAKLGMNDTHFVNTNGLPAAEHYTSAYDIAVMSSALLKHEWIKEYLTNKGCSMNVGLEGKQTTLELINTNKLLNSYNGAIGIKTGFTQDAGYCLSAAAKRENMTLIAVVLGAESSKLRFAEAAKVLDYGFANYEVVQIAAPDEILGSATIEKGQINFTDICSKQEIQVLVPKGTASDISYKVKLRQDLKAPVKEGEKAGTLIVLNKNEANKEYELSAATSVKKAGYRTLLLKSIESILKG